ncbi:hypothetical protein KDX38_10885 [Pseudomonas sp. CDFA 602]|uniref:hypothetical protein n=1 Tax=Pseudomonas californiensis TaxID=2829823 RepID=UPI001E624759|nr:hypothetical protein [Pseudomonas californiensis]MCD5994178.1 hypothetical protein [Pseudomonas californiensis]MCD5999723.1 hypothetical protein [Pseudomonas californiensis]
MLENYFDCLDVKAQEEVRQLAADLGWSLQKAAQEYLKVAKSLAVVSSVERMNRKAPVLNIAGERPPKKGLDSG